MHRFNPDGSEMVTALDENQTLTSPLLPGWSLLGSALYEQLTSRSLQKSDRQTPNLKLRT
jgi:hypothetical protein